MKKFFEEFKEFINQGNVMDLAVAVVIGTAFTAIVNSVVSCLLYTSPSPRDRQKSRMPSSA